MSFVKCETWRYEDFVKMYKYYDKKPEGLSTLREEITEKVNNAKSFHEVQKLLTD